MIKKITFLLSFFIMIIPVFSLDLSGTTWGPEKGGQGYYLRFQSEKDFDFIYSGEGGGQNVSGIYARNGNDVTLTPVIVNDWGELPAYIKQKTISCTIKETDSLFSQYKLFGSGGLELWSSSHVPKDGERCTMDGITMYAFRANGEVTENARVRERPGLQYKFYSFSFEDDPQIFNALPKGYGVRIFGYSENKTTVDGIEKPWYYCVFRINMWEQQYGWIWGGLIEF
jgi:hypothetical protein